MGVGFENKHIHGLKKCFNSKPPLVYDKIYEIALPLLGHKILSIFISIVQLRKGDQTNQILLEC